MIPAEDIPGLPASDLPAVTASANAIVKAELAPDPEEQDTVRFSVNGFDFCTAFPQVSAASFFPDCWRRRSMLAETIAYRNVYIICGYTDMRKSINGLVAILTQQYQIKPDSESLYLF